MIIIIYISLLEQNSNQLLWQILFGSMHVMPPNSTAKNNAPGSTFDGGSINSSAHTSAFIRECWEIVLKKGGFYAKQIITRQKTAPKYGCISKHHNQIYKILIYVQCMIHSMFISCMMNHCMHSISVSISVSLVGMLPSLQIVYSFAITMASLKRLFINQFQKLLHWQKSHRYLKLHKCFASIQILTLIFS